MKLCVFLTAAAAMLATAALGQEVSLTTFEERAAELRAELTCPTDVDWPPLPEAGQRVFGEVRAIPEGGMIPERGIAISARGQEPPDPSVPVPQYGYFLNPHVPRCHPVVIVQSSELAIGYHLIGTDHMAASLRPFFILLGTQAPGRGDSL